MNIPAELFKPQEGFKYQGLPVPAEAEYRIVDKNSERVHLECTDKYSSKKGIAKSIFIPHKQFKEKFTPMN